MKNIIYSFAFFAIFAITSCSNDNHDLPIPGIGQTMQEIEASFALSGPEIDKTTYPNVWILKDYNALIEFENNKVKHVIISGASTSLNMQTLIAGCKKIGGGNVHTVFEKDGVYKYWINHFLTAEVIFVPKDEALKIATSLNNDSDEYYDAGSIVKNEDAIDKIKMPFWKALFL